MVKFRFLAVATLLACACSSVANKPKFEFDLPAEVDDVPVRWEIVNRFRILVDDPPHDPTKELVRRYLDYNLAVMEQEDNKPLPTHWDSDNAEYEHTYLAKKRKFVVRLWSAATPTEPCTWTILRPPPASDEILAQANCAEITATVPADVTTEVMVQRESKVTP